MKIRSLLLATAALCGITTAFAGNDEIGSGAFESEALDPILFNGTCPYPITQNSDELINPLRYSHETVSYHIGAKIVTIFGGGIARVKHALRGGTGMSLAFGNV